MVAINLWTFISVFLIIVLIIGGITAAVFADRHNKNARVIPCPPCYADCSETTLSSQSGCPVNPQTCSEGRCIYNYLNFPGKNINGNYTAFCISPLSILNTNNAMFSQESIAGTLLLSPYGTYVDGADGNSVGRSFAYVDGYLYSADGAATLDEWHRLTIVPQTTLPQSYPFSTAGATLAFSDSFGASAPEIATFEFLNGNIIGRLGGNTYYLGWQPYVNAGTTYMIVVALPELISFNNKNWIHNAFRTVSIPTDLLEFPPGSIPS